MAGKDKERDPDLERDQDEQQRVIISDKRHSRDDKEIESAEEEAPPAKPAPERLPEPERTPAAADAQAPAEPAAATKAQQERPVPPADGIEPPDAHDEMAHSVEMEQLKLIFEAGLPAYLAGQISMFINFALIYLGRAANPATGLVAVDIKKAKSAIDTLEFVSAQIKDELPPAEQKQLGAIVADLKLNFTQAAIGGEPLPPKGNGS